MLVLNGKKGDEIPETLAGDIKHMWGIASGTVDELLRSIAESHDKNVEGTARALRYMGFDPSARTSENIGSVLFPIGAAVKNRGTLLEGVAADVMPADPTAAMGTGGIF